MRIEEYIEKNPSQMHLVCQITSCTIEKCRKTPKQISKNYYGIKIYGLLAKGQSEQALICSKK